MNKLREKLDKAHRGYLTPSNVTKECEQITDDFSVKLIKWYDNLTDENLKDFSYTELQQYFKENIYEA